MKLANFTPEEIADKAKYQWVYRRVGKKASRGDAFLTPPSAPATLVDLSSGVDTSVSSLTLDESPPNEIELSLAMTSSFPLS